MLFTLTVAGRKQLLQSMYLQTQELQLDALRKDVGKSLRRNPPPVNSVLSSTHMCTKLRGGREIHEVRAMHEHDISIWSTAYFLTN